MHPARVAFRRGGFETGLPWSELDVAGDPTGFAGLLENG